MVFVAARYLEDTLSHERDQRVAPFPSPPLLHMVGNGLAQVHLRIRLRQPTDTAIRSETPAIKGGLQRERRRGIETHLCCGVSCHEDGLFLRRYA